uniref:Uncharacterized protein n=1 Tax=Zea mays TaxID=4577 RepID=C0PI67_MAIZE|nr:unknown [Zea mays]
MGQKIYLYLNLSDRIQGIWNPRIKLSSLLSIQTPRHLLPLRYFYFFLVGSNATAKTVYRRVDNGYDDR